MNAGLCDWLLERGQDQAPPPRKLKVASFHQQPLANLMLRQAKSAELLIVVYVINPL
jgi:hypothetical protein